jgi:hypothetical protein
MSDEILRNVPKHAWRSPRVTTATNLSGLDFLGREMIVVVGRRKICPFLSNFIMNYSFIFFHIPSRSLSVPQVFGWKERQNWRMMTLEISTPQSGKRDHVEFKVSLSSIFHSLTSSNLSILLDWDQANAYNGLCNNSILTVYF